MTLDNEYYTKAVEDLSAQLKAGITSREEMNKVTRNLISAHIKLEQYEEAKELLRTHFNFSRKDLLIPLAKLSHKTDDTNFAEELIGEIRCYAYTWMEFAASMQELYIKHGETEKAETIANSIMEYAFMSIRPATKALAKSLELQGKISDSFILKNLYQEIKRINKEHNIS